MDKVDKVYEGPFFFVTREIVPNRKTPIYHINSWDDYELGQVKWYPSWRKYCFYPNGDTIWDNKCLSGLLKFMDILNKSVKEKQTNGKV